MFESVARTEVGSPSHSMSQYSLHLLASFTGAMLCCCTCYQKKGFRRAPTRSAGAQNIAPTMESVMATSRIVLSYICVCVVIVMSNTITSSTLLALLLLLLLHIITDLTAIILWYSQYSQVLLNRHTLDFNHPACFM